MRRSISFHVPSSASRTLGNHLPYVCASCRHQALCQRTSKPQQPFRRNASSGLPWTERVRRKIWGTDNPPGLKDPYGGPSYFERRRQANAEKRLQRAQEEARYEEPMEEQRPPPLQQETSYQDLDEERRQSQQESSDSKPEEQRKYLQRQGEGKRAPQKRRLGKSIPKADPAKKDPTYVPAETWDGLEHVGLSGHWSEKPISPLDSFQP